VKNILKLLSLILTVLIVNHSFAQKKVYYGTDVFMPAHYKKNDIKISASILGYDHSNHSNYKLAYSFNDYFFVKSSYKRKRHSIEQEIRNPTYGIDEFDFSFGFHKYILRSRFNDRRNKAYNLKNEWKNERRKYKGLEPRVFDSNPKQAAFIFESSVGYGFADLSGLDYYYSQTGPVKIKSIDLNVERYNLDLCLYYITRNIFEIAYNVRTSLVNFKNIKINDILPIEDPNAFDAYLNTIDFLSLKDPFLVFENNLKFNLNFKYFDLYMKVNNVFGDKRIYISNQNEFELKYPMITYNNSIVLGVAVDIDSFEN